MGPLLSETRWQFKDSEGRAKLQKVYIKKIKKY